MSPDQRVAAVAVRAGEAEELARLLDDGRSPFKTPCDAHVQADLMLWLVYPSRTRSALSVIKTNNELGCRPIATRPRCATTFDRHLLVERRDAQSADGATIAYVAFLDGIYVGCLGASAAGYDEVVVSRLLILGFCAAVVVGVGVLGGIMWALVTAGGFLFFWAFFWRVHYGAVAQRNWSKSLAGRRPGEAHWSQNQGRFFDKAPRRPGSTSRR
jgi:hypothetical protein